MTLVHVAKRLFGIRLFREREWKNYFHGRATWADAEGVRGRRLQAHEVVKRVLRDPVLSNPNPRGATFHVSSVLVEPLHLRRNKSRPGDIMALGRDVHMLDTVMDLVIASSIT